MVDDTFFSIPAVAADGRIYVAFLNVTASDDEYAVVEVSPQTGEKVAGPFTVATLIDGSPNRPIAFVRQIYQDSIFRAAVLGNITADPTNPAHLAVIWPDMRNSPPPPQNLDPYSSITNADVIVSQSFDNGRTWSTPVAFALGGDQFMPWGTYDDNGILRIGFYDRQYDVANDKYGYTLATETAPGALTFTTKQLTTALSDPTAGNRWFARTLNQLFPFATLFIGDYSTIAAVPGGARVLPRALGAGRGGHPRVPRLSAGGAGDCAVGGHGVTEKCLALFRHLGGRVSSPASCRPTPPPAPHATLP